MNRKTVFQITSTMALFVSAACLASAAVPYGKEIKQGAVSISLSVVAANPFAGVPSSVPTSPAGRDGFMVSIATDTPETSAFVVTAKIKLADGPQITVSQTVQKFIGWSKYTSTLFLVGKVAEIVSVTVDELKPIASSDFTE